MATKNFVTYINQTLGSSDRLLLPSFWWKRIFGEVANTIDAAIKEEVIDKRPKIVEVSSTPLTIKPNMYYVATTPVKSEILNVTLAEPEDPTILNTYTFEFETNSSDDVVLLFAKPVDWVGGIQPIFKKRAKYRISVVNNIASYEEIAVASVEDYCTIEALEDDTQIVFIGRVPLLGLNNSLEYCLNGNLNSWRKLPETGIYVNAGTKVLLRGECKSITYSEVGEVIGGFEIDKRFNLSGNCMSLTYGDKAKSNVALTEGFSILFAGNPVERVSKDFLPAKVLSKKYAYQLMFEGCENLLEAPDLPAVQLNTYCYNGMFKGCSSLISAPKIEASKMKQYSCAYMFSDCKSLTYSPDLIATTLAAYCYDHMFEGCSALETMPVLHATKLVDYCYNGMFTKSGVITASLNADSVGQYSCLEMFALCDKLTNVETISANTVGSYGFSKMFNKCSNLKTVGELSIETLEDSYNCESMFNSCTSLEYVPTLSTEILTEYCYDAMFAECTSLSIAPELLATSLARYCYHSMFRNCTGLTKAPELPVTTVAHACYSNMFEGCSNLTEAPSVLPALELIDYCYQSMFRDCINLTVGPEICATNAAYYCFNRMFQNTGLIIAPELPVTTLANSCCHMMFADCKNLTKAPVLLAQTLTNNCYENMFTNCTNLNLIEMYAVNSSYSVNFGTNLASSGTVVLNENRNFGINTPSGWSVENGNIQYSDLTITANNVNWDDTTTTIKWAVTVSIIDTEGNVNTNQLSGTDTSNSFPINESETETVEREITFEKFGLTTTTVITQGVYIPKGYTINLNDQWRLSELASNPNETSYDGVYESFSNYGIPGEQATMYITVYGYDSFTLYYRACSSNSDILWIYNQNNSGEGVYGSSYTPTSTSDYMTRTITGLNKEKHTIRIVFSKEGSTSLYDDRGYILIPKNQ